GGSLDGASGKKKETAKDRAKAAKAKGGASTNLSGETAPRAEGSQGRPAAAPDGAPSRRTESESDHSSVSETTGEAGKGKRPSPGQGAPAEAGASARSAASDTQTSVSASSKVRKNTLDEMTVGRTEVPLAKGPLPTKPLDPADDAKPLIRGKIGAGSYEDPTDEKRRRGRPKKSGRPGR
ncbi:MAG: hypothetical protein ABJI06_14865, partial [Roseibium sp.]